MTISKTRAFTGHVSLGDARRSVPRREPASVAAVVAPTDADALQRIAGIAAVAEMTSTWAHPLPAGEAGRRIAAARALNRDGKSLIMGITVKGDPDTVVGTIGSGAPAEGAATIGYMLDPAMHGRGIATEAVRAFVRMLFTHTDVELVAASCRVSNAASRRVLEKNGFEVVRTGAFETKVRGEIEVDFHELSRRDWREQLVERGAGCTLTTKRRPASGATSARRCRRKGCCTSSGVRERVLIGGRIVLTSRSPNMRGSIR